MLVKSKLRDSPEVHDKPGRLPETRTYGREFAEIAVYTGLTWAQGQLDRILIGIIGGAMTLGLVSFASAISRALGDAVASSIANVLRSELARMSPGDDIRDVVRPVLIRGIWLATFATFLMAVPARYVLDYLLAPEWQPTIEMIPILALTAIPSILSWSTPVLNIATSTGRRAVAGPFVAIAMGPAVAALAIVDFRLFAVGVFLREILMVLTNYTLMGRQAPWNMFVRALIHSLALAVLFIIIYPDLIISS